VRFWVRANARACKGCPGERKMGSSLEIPFYDESYSTILSIFLPPVRGFQFGVMSFFDGQDLINYLKAANLKVGLLINFGSRSLEHKRFVYNL